MDVDANDDLWTSGRLSKLTRCYGRNENETLGALINVYRLTQRARVYADRPDRIATVIVIAFDDDDDANKFMDAMIRSQLASMREDGLMVIHGNSGRIAAQDEWRRKQKMGATAGGKARAEKGSRDGSGRFKKSNDLPAANPAPSSLDQPVQPSLVLDLQSWNTNTQAATAGQAPPLNRGAVPDVADPNVAKIIHKIAREKAQPKKATAAEKAKALADHEAAKAASIAAAERGE